MDFKTNDRLELKNINSFRFARKALEFEIARQSELLEKGETPGQQTRGWSESKNATVPQREKEEANDYRYFPEPDIPPLYIDEGLRLKIKGLIPELPDQKSARFQREFGLSEQIAEQVVENKETAEYFEEAAKLLAASKQQQATSADVANWIVNKKIDMNTTVPAQLVQQIVQSKQTSQVDEKELEKIVKQVLAENQKIVEDFKSGKKQVLGFLIGAVRKKIEIDPKDLSSFIVKIIGK